METGSGVLLFQTMQGSVAWLLPWNFFNAAGQLPITWWPQVMTGFSEVIGSWNIIAISLPRIACILWLFSFRRSVVFLSFPEKKISLWVYAQGRWKQLQDGEGRYRFARTGFSYQCHDLVRIDRKRNIFQRFGSRLIQ